jgi:hypothetical protein
MGAAEPKAEQHVSAEVINLYKVTGRPFLLLQVTRGTHLGLGLCSDVRLVALRDLTHRDGHAQPLDKLADLLDPSH